MEEDQQAEQSRSIISVPDAQPGQSTPTGAVVGPRRGLLRNMLIWVRSLFSPRPPRIPPLVMIRIARLAGDTDGKQLSHLIKTLKKRSGLGVRTISRILDPGAEEQAQEMRSIAIQNARRYLAGDESDLLIWGGVDQQSRVLDLYLTSARCDEEDRPGLFGTGTRMILPVDFDEGFAALLASAALAAASQGRGPRLQRAQALLAIVVDSVHNVDHEAVNLLTPEQRAVDQAIYATLSARASILSGRNDWMTGVLELIELALKDLPASVMPIERGLTLRNYAGLLLAKVERRQSIDSADALEIAEEALREALQLIDGRLFPEDWAAIQDRLGHVLYRRDEESSDGERLREAVGAYKAALHVFTRTYYPLRWANLMNSLSQALQVLGEQMRSPELLKKAILAAYSALEVRTPEVAPYSWAASQNNLGSALYLLTRYGGDANHYQEAYDAFANALEFYQSQSQQKLATVTQRNLEKLEAEAGRKFERTVAQEVESPPLEETDERADQETADEPRQETAAR